MFTMLHPDPSQHRSISTAFWRSRFCLLPGSRLLRVCIIEHRASWHTSRHGMCGPGREIFISESWSSMLQPARSNCKKPRTFSLMKSSTSLGKSEKPPRPLTDARPASSSAATTKVTRATITAAVRALDDFDCLRKLVLDNLSCRRSSPNDANPA